MNNNETFNRLSIDNFLSFHESFMNDIFQKTWHEYENKLKEYLIQNLNRLGIKFESDEKFIEFIKSRVKRVSFDNQPNYYQFYVDFVSIENPGTFIGSYSDEFEIGFTGNTAIATIGRKFRNP